MFYRRLGCCRWDGITGSSAASASVLVSVAVVGRDLVVGELGCSLMGGWG